MPSPLKKILLVPQLSRLDYQQGYELLKFIAELEDGPCPYADVMLSLAHSTPENPEVIKMLRDKFSRVIIHKCNNAVSGWPHGPNNQACEVFQSVFTGHRDKGWDYAAFMMIEPDSTPLAKDWIKVLYDEWHEAHQLALGAWLEVGDSECATPHINGNCLLSPELIKQNKSMRYPASTAWDVLFSKILMANGRASSFIWSDYHLGTDRNPWKSCKSLFAPKQYKSEIHPLAGKALKPVWLHGIKTMQGLECAKEKLIK
jgi:hypothetical protein